MKVTYNITQNKFNANLNQETTEIKVKFQTGYYPLPGGGGGDLSNYYTKDETYSKTEVDDIIADIPVVDTSNLVPYTGATQDVNIASNYFKTSKGFDLTYDNDNYFRSIKIDNHYYILEFKSKDESEDNFDSIELIATPEVGLEIIKKDNNDLALNFFSVNNLETRSLKPFVSDSGFKTPTGTETQALTANGDTFDLNTKADLVSGKIPASQLPAYVDDVLEFANLASFPATGESGKIYIAIDTNLSYRWGGSSYVVMSSSLALGETSSTAYRGDRGKIAYDHSQVVGNPHGTTKTDIGLGNVPNIDATNPTNIIQTSSYRFVTDSEKTNLSTAYTHSQATGNPHNTKVEELTDLGSETTSIADTDVILKKEVVGGFWRKITWENIKASLKTYFDSLYDQKAFNIKVTTPSFWVTGTMSETEVLRIEIPANSLSDSDVLRIPFLMINKVGTAGTIFIRGKLSTSQTMPSSWTDQIFQTAIVAATNKSVGLDRSFIIDNGKLKGFPAGIPSYTSSTISSNIIESKPFDITVTNYLYISITLGNTADQARLEGLQLTNS